MSSLCWMLAVPVSYVVCGVCSPSVPLSWSTWKRIFCSRICAVAVASCADVSDASEIVVSSVE